MNAKFETMSKVKLANGQTGFILSIISQGGSLEYRLGMKPDNNCYHEQMGWFPESMIIETLKVYRKGRYWLSGVWN